MLVGISFNGVTNLANLSRHQTGRFQMSVKRLDMSDPLYEYMLSHSLQEPDVLAALRREYQGHEEAGWQISPEQGQFMALLARIAGVTRFLEVGTFIGYGSLWIALSLPRGGQVVTCELAPQFPDIGAKYWRDAGVADKIDLRLGDARATMQTMIDAGEADSFDMAFIDADKPGYPTYYEQCLQLVRPGGTILIDNIFWGGAVIDPSDNRGSTRALRELNSLLAKDDRIHLSMLPIGDGLAIAQKK